jgi:hypothetical protein
MRFFYIEVEHPKISLVYPPIQLPVPEVKVKVKSYSKRVV